MTHLDEILRIKGKNLFDVSKFNQASDWTGTNYKYIEIPLPNGTYTISWDISTMTAGNSIYWLLQVDEAQKGTSGAGSGGSWIWHSDIAGLQHSTFTFTVTQGAVWLSCAFSDGFKTKFLPALLTVQIEEGSTATPYESYTGEFKSIGNIWERGVNTDTSKSSSVQFRNTRKAVNLFDKNTKSGPISGGYSNKMPAKAGTTYLVKNFNRSDRADSTAIKGYTTSNEEIRITPTYYPNGTSYMDCEYYYATIPEGVVEFVVGIRPLTSGNNVHWEDLMIVEGTTAPTAFYLYFSPTKVLPSLKAFGADPIKVKAPKLWGRYVPVEYIESGGTQYIDTGIIADNNTEVELDYAIGGSGSVYIFGTRVSGAQYFTISGSQTGGTNTNFVNGNSANINVGNRVTGTWNRLYQKIATNNGTVNWNAINKDTGVSKSGTYNATIPTLEATIKLFSNGTEYESHGRIYSCKLKQNGALVRDFVPVKDVTNNVYGMFDRVTETFYGNSGDGTFTGGELIQPISYAESTGTQYFDLEYTFENSTKIEFTITKTGANQGYTDTESRGNVWFGANGSTGQELMLGWGNSGSANYFRGTGSGIFGNWKPSLNTKYHIEFTYEKGNGQLYVDGVKQGATALTTNSTDGRSILIGAVRDNSTVTPLLYCKEKFHNEVKMWNGDTLLRDYIPIRVGTTVELLDIVSWTFATRVGTLTAGADIPYTQLCPDVIKVAKGELAYGQWGKNLFDGVSNIVYGKYIMAATGEVGNSDTNYYCETYFEVKPNTSYVLWGERKSDSYISRYNRIHFYDATKTFISSSTYVQGQKSVVTSPATAKYARISCNVLNTASQPCNAAQVALFNWYFGEGTATTEYEPYHFGLHADGQHKVFMGEQGVVDLGTLTWSYSATLGCGKTFYASLSAKTLNGKVICFCDGYTGITANSAYGAQMNVDKVCWIEDGRSIRFHDDIYNGDTTAFKAAMSGKYLYYQRTTDTEFIPPITKTIDELLFHSTDYKDIQSGDEVHNWGVKVLDGTESWTNPFAGTGRFILSDVFRDLINYGTGSYINLYCTHFEASASATTGSVFGCGFYKNSQTEIAQLRITYPTMTELSDFEAYLAQQYAKGTPVIVLYPLATPTTTPHTATPISLTTKTTRVVTSESELATTNQVTYLGKGGVS